VRNATERKRYTLGQKERKQEKRRNVEVCIPSIGPIVKLTKEMEADKCHEWLCQYVKAVGA
jgi:hypothetical protein